MADQTIKCLLVPCDHAHIKFYLSWPSLASQMASLSVKFHMSFYIFQPWLKDHVCHGWVTTLQFVNLRFTQFAEFLYHHLHFITGWISSRGNLDNAGFRLLMFLRKFSWGRCQFPPNVCSKVYMVQMTMQCLCGFFCQLNFKISLTSDWNALGKPRGVHQTCTLSGIYHTR